MIKIKPKEQPNSHMYTHTRMHESVARENFRAQRQVEKFFLSNKKKISECSILFRCFTFLFYHKDRKIMSACGGRLIGLLLMVLSNLFICVGVCVISIDSNPVSSFKKKKKIKENLIKCLEFSTRRDLMLKL